MTAHIKPTPGQQYILKLNSNKTLTIEITHSPDPIHPSLKVDNDDIQFTYIKDNRKGFVTQDMFKQFIDNGYLTPVVV